MHAPLRSLIIAYALGALSLGGAASLGAQTIEVVESYAQVQGQPAQLGEATEQSTQLQDQAPQAAPEQTKEQTREEVAKSEAGPEQSAVPAYELSAQQTSLRAPEQQPAQEPASNVDLSGYAAGTIVVETSERKLHLVLGNGEVLTYPVGVGKKGKNWAGSGAISGKYLRPPWSPPRALKREKPWTPDYIPGGSPKNPMGAAAMTLNIDQYAIHGTNDDGSIGGFVSFGCIRMHNRDILDLYKRVHVGTRVVVLR